MDQLGHRLHFKQKGVVTPRTLNIKVGHVRLDGRQRADQALAVIAWIEPITRKTHYEVFDFDRIVEGRRQGNPLVGSNRNNPSPWSHTDNCWRQSGA